jgi:hypothetical protein
MVHLAGIVSDSSEAEVHSFLVKIWIEPAEGPRHRREWHGRVSHVSDGTVHAFRNLGCLSLYLGAYLRSAGLSVSPWKLVLGRLACRAPWKDDPLKARDALTDELETD